MPSLPWVAESQRRAARLLQMVRAPRRIPRRARLQAARARGSNRVHAQSDPSEPTGRAALARGEADAPCVGRGRCAAWIVRRAPSERGSEHEGGKANESEEPCPRYA